VDNPHGSATFSRTMKSDTLNGLLTFVLGILCVLGVVFAMKVVFVTRESRMLQSEYVQCNSRIVGIRSLLGDVAAYNQKNPSVELTHILQSMEVKPATH
jgi:hypothetical protein